VRVPGALEALQQLGASASNAGIPETTLYMAALVVAIATINAYNRLNAAIRQISGEWVAKIVRGGPGSLSVE
jgi:hypothetical protein